MSENATLRIVLAMSNDERIVYSTEDFVDINQAHDTYREIIERKLSATIRMPEGSSCRIVSGAGIICVDITEVYPDIEAEKARVRRMEKIERIGRVK